MAGKVKVFISWSGELSKKLGQAVADWLPATLQFVKPYFSPVDVEKGTKWGAEISAELENSDTGIICLTRENLNSAWILFEAGALSKKPRSRVCTLLFNVEKTDVTGPLTLLQHTGFVKGDFKGLVETINNVDSDSKLDKSVLDNVFEKWWPELEKTVNEILDKHIPAGEETGRSVPEMIKEILDLTRLHIQGDTPEGFYRGLYEQYRRYWATRGLLPPLDMMEFSIDPHGNIVPLRTPPAPTTPKGSSSVSSSTSSISTSTKTTTTRPGEAESPGPDSGPQK